MYNLITIIRSSKRPKNNHLAGRSGKQEKQETKYHTVFYRLPHVLQSGLLNSQGQWKQATEDVSKFKAKITVNQSSLVRLLFDLPDVTVLVYFDD